MTSPTPKPAPSADAVIEQIAECMWQAEWKRGGNGGARKVPWTEVADTDRARYRFVAREVAALATLPAAEPVSADSVLNMAKISGLADRETLARSLFLLNEQRGSGAPIRFNCSWDRLKSWSKATFYAAADAIRAASPQPARETVYREALERIARWERHGGDKPLVYPVDIAKEALAAALAAQVQP